MKRSEINAYLRWAVDLLDKYQFKLPRFAYWSFDEWKENKDKQDKFELTQNERLQKDIIRLEESAKSTAKWSNDAEKGKSRKYNDDPFIDKGYVGHKAAKMMKRSKVMEKRIEKAIDEKSKLLNNIDRIDDLKMIPLETKKSPIVYADKLQIKYDEKSIFAPISFEVKQGDRLAIVGKNGVGKSSILKLIMREEIDFEGEFKVANDLKISYVSQSTSDLKEL